MKKKVLSSLSLAMAMVATTMPAQAYTNSEGKVTETKEIKENVSAESCDVYAELGSSFTVTIPKKITLDGTTKKGSYSVSCSGDIAGNEYVSVVPDDSFAMKQTGKDNVTATVTQETTKFRGNDFADSLGTGEALMSTGATGSISASDLTAGSWNGTFNFNVALESTGNSIISETRSAGLYSAGTNNVLKTWQELLDEGVIHINDGVLTTNYVEGTSENNWKDTNTSSDILVGDLVIDDSVTSIDKNAFEICKNLTSVKIPDSVTSIGKSAFYECDNLTTINLPSGITTIENYMFTRCYKLENVIIPDNVTSIGEYSFADCTSLTNIEIPDSVISIDYGAFNDCTGVTNITIGSEVKDIDNTSFHGCTNLTSINVDENNTNYCSVNGVLFNKDMTTLVLYPAGKTETNYIIPSSVTSIGSSAFENCTNLTSIGTTGSGASVEIPDSVISISNAAFYKCTGLTSITIGNSVTSIGDQAFGYSTSLTSVMIPNSITIIGNSAFRGCTNLNNATFETTEGWFIGSSSNPKQTALSSSDLANTSTAATYLADTYTWEYWTRE